MRPGSVADLRPKQLIKLSSDLFLYFFECDYYYHHQLLTSTPVLNLYHSSYAISSVHIISILVYIILHSIYVYSCSDAFSKVCTVLFDFLNTALYKNLSRFLSSVTLAQSSSLVV